MRVFTRVSRDSLDGRIVARLKELMWALGLTTYEVADRAQGHGFLNCTATKVSLISNGNRRASQQELVALARALDTTLHWLISGHGEDGEPVILVATTASAHAVAPPPGTPASVGSP